jgi:hypothetical protein
MLTGPGSGLQRQLHPETHPRPQAPLFRTLPEDEQPPAPFRELFDWTDEQLIDHFVEAFAGFLGIDLPQ